MKQYTRRYRSKLASFGTYECHAEHSGLGPEQVAQHYSISVSRHGCFAVHREGRIEIADRTCALSFNVGDVYRTSHPEGCHDDGIYLSFRRDIVVDIASRYLPEIADRVEGPFPAHSLQISPRATFVAACLADRVALDPSSELEADELALEWLDTVYRDNATRLSARPRSTSPTRSHRDLANDAKRLVARDALQPLSLDTVAAELGVSPFHLCRVFKSVSGTTLRQHVESVRLFAALDAVRDARRDLSAIAFEHGFSSHSHFTDRFHRAFGRTPSELRRARS